MQKRIIELWVGAFVLAGVAALGMLAFKVGNLSGADVKDGYKITAHFHNIGGLTVKAPVSMAGVRVGRVSGITIDRDDYTAVVEMTVDPKYDNLPRDTSASILTQGLLGAQYVGLEPGGDEQYLKDGDRLDITQSAVVLEQLIGQLLFSKAGGEDK
jgi:phospholipid/cholesterol/gamma-HCH transport system substrate-binding protein